MQVMLIQQNGKVLLKEPETAPVLSDRLDMLFPHVKSSLDASKAPLVQWSDDLHLAVLRTIDSPDLAVDNPLRILLTRQQTAALAAWRTNVRIQILFFSLLMVIGVIALWLFERQRMQEIVTTKRLQLATEASGVGIWELDLPTRRYHWDSVMFKLFGLDPKAVSALNDDWQRLLSADDMGLLREATRQMVRQGQNFKVTFKVNRPDGEVRYLQNRATLYSDDKGKPRRMIGTTQDVSEGRQREAEVRLAALAFQSADSMLVGDADGQILRVNQAFTRLFGYEAAEVAGHSTRIIQSPHESDVSLSDMWRHLVRDHEWHGELWQRRKDGQDIYCAFSIIAVCDDAGQVTHYLATQSDITERKQAEEEVKRLAFFDPLTRLPNRRLLSDRLEQAIARTRRASGMLALLYLDLNKFKPVNDMYGHAAGDELLCLVAQRMSACVRASDTVARVGGDEFVVLIPDVKQLPDALQVADKLHVQLSQPFILPSGVVINISSSIGVALYPTHGIGEEDLQRAADVAMYAAKTGGREPICVYRPDMETPAARVRHADTPPDLSKESPPA
jgi:diguanylate cyclase (GGDEF)-like protein/PAS domain S-box-containing protein